MQRLTAEETLLVKIRKNVEVKLLCRTHYDAFLTKFGGNVPLSLPDLPKPTRKHKSGGKP